MGIKPTRLARAGRMKFLKSVHGLIPGAGRLSQQESRPEAIQRAAKLAAQMPMRGKGRQACVPNQFRICAPMPQGQRQYAHQSAITVVAFICTAGQPARYAIAQARDRSSACDPDVEDATLASPIAKIKPVAPAIAEVAEIHSDAMKTQYP